MRKERKRDEDEKDEEKSFLISCISPKNNEQLENNFDDGS